MINLLFFLDFIIFYLFLLELYFYSINIIILINHFLHKINFKIFNIFYVILSINICSISLYGIYQNFLINNIAEILFDKVFIYSYLIIR